MVFSTNSVRYDDSLKTTIRPDVCPELYQKVIAELEMDGYETIEMDNGELADINPLIAKV